MFLWLSAALAACPVDGTLTMRAELYLGRERHGRPWVGPGRWRRFLREEVTPDFPGFTVVDQLGYWQGAPERSRTLVIFHGPAQVEAVYAVAQAYVVRFEQEAVLLVDEPVEVRMCAETEEERRERARRALEEYAAEHPGAAIVQ